MTSLALDTQEGAENPGVCSESRHLSGCPKLSGLPKTVEMGETRAELTRKCHPSSAWELALKAHMPHIG